MRAKLTVALALRLVLLAAAVLNAGCFLPRYDAAGKRCDEAHACPNGLSCIAGICATACQPPPDACSGPERPCISTVAGTDGPGRVDGPPGTARFRRPTNLLVLPSGDLVVADSDNNVLRKIPLDGGAVTTLAGDGTCNDTDPRSLCEPHGLALGPSGELYVTVLGTNGVLRIEGTQITRIVGNSDGLPTGFNRPKGVAVAAGRVIVTDTSRCTLRFYERDGRPSLVDAGIPAAPLGGCGTFDGHTLDWVEYVAVSPDQQTVYFGDTDTLYSAPLLDGLPAGPPRFLAGLDHGFRDGDPALAMFDGPQQLVATADALYLADTRNHRLRRLQLGGTLTTLAGTGSRGHTDGTATGENAALLDGPGGIAVVGGAVYFTTPADGRIGRLENGAVTTVAGRPPSALLDGCAANVQLASPGGVDVDPADGTLYFTDTAHHAVRGLAPNGAVVTLAGGAPGAQTGDFDGARFNAPRSLKVRPDRSIVVADTGNGAVVLLDLVNRRTSWLVGAPRGAGFQVADCYPVLRNPPRTATLCAPFGVAVSASGEIYFTDSSPTGAGLVGRLSADGGQLDLAYETGFSPRGLALGDGGHFLVSEVRNHEVYEIDASGANLGTLLPNNACARGPHYERGCEPVDVAFAGDVLYVLFENGAVLRKRAAGQVLVDETVVGLTHVRGFTEGSFQPLLDRPTALVVAKDGTLYIADTGNHRIRRVLP